MANVRTLKMNLLADVDSFTKGLDEAQSNFAKFGDKLNTLSAKAAIAFGVISYGFKQTLDSASSLNETMNKTAVVFGDANADVMAFAKNSATAVGMSAQSALNAAADFAIFGKSAGLTGKNLANFSTDLLTLAADFSSFSDASPEESLAAIGAALRGESEPIRRFGILLSADAVAAEALAMGLAKSKGEITEGDKVLARQSLILKQSTVQQGDFARTSDSAANAQRSLTASIENARAEIGMNLLPTYQKFLGQLVPVTEWIGKNADAFSKWGIAIGAVAAGIVVLNYTVKTVNMTFEAFNNVMKLATAAQAAFNFVMSMNPIGLVIIGVVALGAAFVVAYKKIEPFRDLVDSIWEKFKNLINGIKNSAIGKGIASAFNAVTEGRAVGGSVSAGQAYRVGELGKEVFVPSSNGSIVPSNQLGGSTVINISGAIDPEGVRRQLERLFQDSGRRTAAVNLAGAAF